jgi:ubiquitin C-terminal hydrolase
MGKRNKKHGNRSQSFSRGFSSSYKMEVFRPKPVKSYSSSVSPERRRQLEHERKQREEFEKNFKCEVESHSNIDAYMVQKLTNRVTFPMENRGNTCFFNSVMQCFTHTVPLHQYCVADTQHKKFCKNKPCLLCTYMEYVKKADQQKRNYTTMIEPFMRKIMPSYRFGMQEDA